MLLALAAAGSRLLCRRLTRPLARLEQTSRQIAAGDYGRRTALRTGDELASLSASFDEMADAVQEKIEQLQENLQAREDFVAAFTHELKTPITSMLGYADLLRSAETTPQTRQLAAQYIYQESRRLEQLGGKLMALMQLAGSPPALEPTALAVVFYRLRRSLPPGEPRAELPDTDARVLADAVLLEDLLYNLIKNARTATPADGQLLGMQLSCPELPDLDLAQAADTLLALNGLDALGDWTEQEGRGRGAALARYSPGGQIYLHANQDAGFVTLGVVSMPPGALDAL